MIEPAIIVARLLQYFGVAILFGASLFFLYALPAAGSGSAAERPWAWRLLAAAAALLVVASLLAIGLQAALFAGSLSAGFTSAAMGEVVAYLDLGKSAVVRAVAGAAALVLLMLLPAGRTAWLVTACLGAVAAGSVAWMGHAAATEGWGAVHLVSDIVHAAAASIWLGALACLLPMLVLRPVPSGDDSALEAALRRFSAIGPAMLAALLLSGVVNGWILVGPGNALEPWSTPYGRLLSIKLLAFLAMLGLAALNRHRFTPALAAGHRSARPALLRSVAAESAAGLAVLALVAWLGTFAPPGLG